MKKSTPPEQVQSLFKSQELFDEMRRTLGEGSKAVKGKGTKDVTEPLVPSKTPPIPKSKPTKTITKEDIYTSTSSKKRKETDTPTPTPLSKTKFQRKGMTQGIS